MVKSFSLFIMVHSHSKKKIWVPGTNTQLCTICTTEKFDPKVLVEYFLHACVRNCNYVKN